MKKNRFFVLLTIITVTVFFHSTILQSKHLSVALLDTTGRSRDIFEPFLTIAKEVGFNITYYPLDTIIDKKSLSKDLEQYKSIFLFLNTTSLKAMHKSKNIINCKILRSITNFSRKKDKLIALFFPSFSYKHVHDSMRLLFPIFNAIGLQSKHGPILRMNQHIKNVGPFLYHSNKFLMYPLEKQTLDYETSLNTSRSGSDFSSVSNHFSHYLKLLPNSQQNLSKANNKKSYGLYWFDSFHHNHLFVSFSTIAIFSSISENFFLCPLSYKKRKNLLVRLQKTLDELFFLVAKNKSVSINNKIPSTAIQAFGKPIATTKSHGSAVMKKTAWMEMIEIFNAHDQKSNEQQDNLISYIFDANLDALWISLSPNMYHSPIAQQQDKTADFYQALSQFTKKLSENASKRGKAVPRILVGFEIANNIYEPNLPKHPAQDIYGNTYDDVPSPLSRSFWYNEIQKPLADFMKKWTDSKISHGLTISGIVIDFEMYGCQRKSCIFSDLMGFNRSLTNRFAQKKIKLLNKRSEKAITRLLIKKKLVSKYYNFLEEEAFKLGYKLKTAFYQLIPNCIIGCYTPMILTNWFYKGLFKGMSSPTQPLQLFTFNIEFNKHQWWFNKNRINAQHSVVLLLSKIKQKKDFERVASALKHHHGVWFNRFSRLVQAYDADSWMAIEQTPLSDQEKKDFLNYLDKIR